MREAVHGQRGRGAAGGRGRGRPPRPGRDGGVPLRVPPHDAPAGGDRAVGRARHHQGDRHLLLGPLGQTGRHPLPTRSGRRRHDGHGLLPDLAAAPAGRGAPGHRRHRQALLPRRRPRHGRPLLPPRGRHGPGALLHVLHVRPPPARRGDRERRDAQGLQPLCAAVRAPGADRERVGHAQGEVLPPGHLRLPTRGLRRRRRGRCPVSHHRGRRHPHHGVDRRHLRGGRAPDPPADLDRPTPTRERPADLERPDAR